MTSGAKRELKCGDLLFAVAVEIFEARRIGKPVRLELVQLDVRHEPLVANVFDESLLQKLNSFVGQVSQLFGRKKLGKVSMDCVQVDHRGEDKRNWKMQIDPPIVGRQRLCELKDEALPCGSVGFSRLPFCHQL